MASLLKQTYMHKLNTMIKLVQIFLFNTKFILPFKKIILTNIIRPIWKLLKGHWLYLCKDCSKKNLSTKIHGGQETQIYFSIFLKGS